MPFQNIPRAFLLRHLPYWLARGVAALLSLSGLALLLHGHERLLPQTQNAVLVAPQAPAILAMTLAGMALWLRIEPARTASRTSRRLRKVLAQALATTVILLGLAGLVAAALPYYDGLAPLRAWLTMHMLPGQRISLLVGLCFVMSGLALLLLDWRRWRRHYPAEYLALAVAGIMCMPLIGFLSSAGLPGGLPTPMVSRQMPLSFLVLAAGILLARAGHPMIATLFSNAPGGRLLRSVMPATLALLLALNLLMAGGARLQLYGPEVIFPLVVLMGGGLMLPLFWRAAYMLNQEHISRIRGEAELARTNDIIRVVSDCTTDAIHVKDRKGRLIFANPATLALLGKSLPEVLGHQCRDLLPDREVAEEIDAHSRAVLADGRPRSMEFSLTDDRGARTWHLTSAPWFGANGEALGTVGISTDITNRKRSEDAVRAHEAQLERLVEERTHEVRELVGHLESLREEEKRTLARELHDDLGSSLTALNMHLAILFQNFAGNPEVTERALQVRALLDSVAATTRRIQNGLRPDKLDIFGIKTAITEQAQDFENYTGVSCTASLPDEEIKYSSEVEITLFRMVQEALNNIAKHARASRVEIVLDDDGDHIILCVRDNGIGIAASPQQDCATHGLRGMRERAAWLGGSIEIDSIPGAGTRIRVRLPKADIRQPLPPLKRFA